MSVIVTRLWSINDNISKNQLQIILNIFQHCSSCSQITSTWLKSEDLSMTMVQWSSWTKSRTLLRQFWKTRIFCQNMIKYFTIFDSTYIHGFVKLKSMWYSQTKQHVLFENNKFFLLTLLIKSSSHVIRESCHG